MTAQPVIPEGSPPPLAPYSAGTLADGVLYVSGTLAIDSDGQTVGIGDAAAQTKHVLDALGRANFEPVHFDRHHWQAPQCSTVANRLKLVVKDFHDARKRAQVGRADANLRGSVWEHLFDLNARESTNLRGRGSERMNTPNPFGNMKLPISCVCAATCMRRRSECAPVISSIMRLSLVSDGPVMIGTSPIFLTLTEFDYAKGWIAPTIQTAASMPLSTNRDENAQVTETGTPARSRVPQIAWSNFLTKMQGKCRARHRKRFTFRKWCAYIGYEFGLVIGGLNDSGRGACFLRKNRQKALIGMLCL